MRDERTNFPHPAQACVYERSPACGESKPLSGGVLDAA
jgi:hypothetical protein